MKITKENIKKFDKVYTHDYYITNFNYDPILNKLSVNLERYNNDFKDMEIIFSEIIYFEFSNTKPWGGNADIQVYHTYVSKDNKCLNRLIKEYNDNNLNKNEKSNDGPNDLDKEKILEINMELLNGNVLTILCKKIEVIYFDN